MILIPVSPVSSFTSLSAASSLLSPFSTRPFGSAHLLLWSLMRSIFTSPSLMNTTPPAETWRFMTYLSREKLYNLTPFNISYERSPLGICPGNGTCCHTSSCWFRHGAEHSAVQDRRLYWNPASQWRGQRHWRWRRRDTQRGGYSGG